LFIYTLVGIISNKTTTNKHIYNEESRLLVNLNKRKMAIYTTEITSETITSDNPIHQRLLKAYYAAMPYIHGKILEVGCGEGRGIRLLKNKTSEYVALDRHQAVLDKLQKEHPKVKFLQKIVPPFTGISDNEFDVVIAFQVIEHIKKDRLFLQEIQRVLKPGGKAIISTPNIKMTLTRNPWHIREYTADELKRLAESIFAKVSTYGIAGNEKVMEYYAMNKASVYRITRYDVLSLQYRLPNFVLRLPYELLNRMNRNKLKTTDNDLVKSITHHDYLVSESPGTSLDLFYVMEK